MAADRNVNHLFYDLSVISGWQLDLDNSVVELPAMQRGFVWKVNQIEALWDSILRGFPIGSFLLSKTDNKKFFLLDGQQRATAIALGFYDPWQESYNKEKVFWSIKKTPVIWLDLLAADKTNTQKFVIRVVTQSHPWGYQRKENAIPLSIPDRRNALVNFRKDPRNSEGFYIGLSPLNVYPYDADLPVPLPFLIKAISTAGQGWRESLITMCKEHLPNSLATKYEQDTAKTFWMRLTERISGIPGDGELYKAVSSLGDIRMPAIIIEQEILRSEDEQTGEDPTLFVRLNSSGTRIAGDELIYSIYKATFPRAKDLVESIGASFIAPAQVISLVSRLAWSELNDGNYPYIINVNDFRKRILEDGFRNKLQDYIGDDKFSPAGLLFNKAFELIASDGTFNLPAVLVKQLVKGSQDLFLFLLQWLKLNDREITYSETKSILATITALSWFCKDNIKFVRQLWPDLMIENVWDKHMLSKSYKYNGEVIMHPLLPPSSLRSYLLDAVPENSVRWGELYPEADSQIMNLYRSCFSSGGQPDTETEGAVTNSWDNFRGRLIGCRSLLLFVQRKYINQNFGEFNQMETLEDTNTPWDWDHIYPSSWVYRNWNIDPNTRHWSNSIGNLRALSLEENRGESDSLSPKARLEKVKEQSFIKGNDWVYWSKIDNKIKEGDKEMIKEHLSAIIHRLCNIYEEWYTNFDVGRLF